MRSTGPGARGLSSHGSRARGHRLRRRGPWAWLGFPGGSVVRSPPTGAEAAGDGGSIPGLARSPGGGNGNPPQHCCLGKPMAREAWRATVHVVAKSRTRLSDQARTHGLSRSVAFGIPPDQGSNPRLLHWQANSLPLSHQGSPWEFFLTTALHPVPWWKMPCLVN